MQLCSYIKHGLSCFAACKHCHGEPFQNSEVHNSDGDSDEDEQPASWTVDMCADVFQEIYLDFYIQYTVEEIVYKG